MVKVLYHDEEIELDDKLAEGEREFDKLQEETDLEKTIEIDLKDIDYKNSGDDDA